MMTEIEPIAALQDITVLLTECGLPVRDITLAGKQQFFGIRSGSNLVAIVGIELSGSFGLLRSLAVSPPYRGHGLARRLVAYAEHIAAARHANALFLLTTTAATFFEQLGFVPASRSDAPPAIQATQQFKELCPASSAFLVKSLGKPHHPPDRAS